MQEDQKEEKAFFVNNAGLVIIAPFLSRYFKRLGMLSEHEFKDEASAVRAVHLLQYIVSSNVDTPEQLLLLNKILCGLSINTPIPERIELLEAEEQLTQELLHAILANWEKLKNISIENFRESFLLREGKLEWKEEGYWLLTVERKPFDLLMESLPWSISIINNKWMPNQVQVSWL